MLFGALFSTVNLSKKIPNDQNFYLPDVFFYQFDSDVISYSSNDNRFEPENKKAHINQNVQVQDLPKPIGVPNVKSSVTGPILMLK